MIFYGGTVLAGVGGVILGEPMQGSCRIEIGAQKAKPGAFVRVRDIRPLFFGDFCILCKCLI